jgi:hypothetical protein
MNHDIIAAGHPALRFDMATYHNRLPKHWRDQQATDSARFEAQLWAAGAIAGADAWLSLMQGRAQDSNSVSTWPELSAYDCSSCHHDLSLNNQRSPLSDPTQRGLAKQSLWNTYSFTDLLAEKTLPRTKQELTLAQFDAIRNHLEASPSPNPVHLVELVISARQGLASWSVGEEFRPHANRFSTSIVSSFQPDQIAQIALQSATDDRGLSTWETASQNYLLQIASRHSWPVAQRSQLTELASLMRRGLSLPLDSNSPQFSLRYPVGPVATRDEIGDLLRQISKLRKVPF